MKTVDQGGAIRKKIDDYSYLLNQNIGKGYSSQVFKGRSDLTEQSVAIKVIDMKMIKNEIHKNLLSSEIEVLKQLKNSDNIIEVLDIYTTKNNTYIITELCDGDLSKLVNKDKCLSEAEAIPLMNQIINGYISFYNHQIIHRDLKPANIFLKNNQIKIADFGFAMKHTDAQKYSSYNVGSPVYMAPQALKENKYSFKSDIWALGVIYYEMLTGKTPWRAKTQKELAKQIISIPIKKLLPPSISPSSETFLLKTLALDIKQRMRPEDILNYRLNSEKAVMGRKQNPFNSINLTSRQTETVVEKTKRKDTSLNKHLDHNVQAKNKESIESNQEIKHHHLGSLKTATTISQKSTHFITSSIANTPSSKILTQKSINITKSLSSQLIIKESMKEQTHYDKKQLSKQLLSQIHFCRFMFKLIKRMKDKLNEQMNSGLDCLKSYMAGFIFQKLGEVQKLNQVPAAFVKDFQVSNDFQKISQIISQYQQKYSKDLSMLHFQTHTSDILNDQLDKSILSLYETIKSSVASTKKEQVIVLDYLITLKQLTHLIQSSDIEIFHTKSKIQKIVEGSPSQTISSQHVDAITSKLKAMKLI